MIRAFDEGAAALVLETGYWKPLACLTLEDRDDIVQIL